MTAPVDERGFTLCCRGYAECFEHCPRGEFFARVEVMDSGCHEWRGATKAGYGQFRRNLLAHRVAYEFEHGTIPAGLHIDHLCRNRLCVNPAHLEAVTPAENNRRAAAVGHHNSAKTHCPQGHEYSPENTYIAVNGSRTCRTCRAAARRAYQDRREMATLEAHLRSAGKLADRRPTHPGLPAWLALIRVESRVLAARLARDGEGRR